MEAVSTQKKWMNSANIIRRKI